MGATSSDGRGSATALRGSARSELVRAWTDPGLRRSILDQTKAAVRSARSGSILFAVNARPLLINCRPDTDRQTDRRTDWKRPRGRPRRTWNDRPAVGRRRAHCRCCAWDRPVIDKSGRPNDPSPVKPSREWTRTDRRTDGRTNKQTDRERSPAGVSDILCFARLIGQCGGMSASCCSSDILCIFINTDDDDARRVSS